MSETGDFNGYWLLQVFRWVFWVAASWKQTLVCSLYAIIGSITCICSGLETRVMTSWHESICTAASCCASVHHTWVPVLPCDVQPARRAWVSHGWYLNISYVNTGLTQRKSKSFCPDLYRRWCPSQNMNCICPLGALLINWYGASMGVWFGRQVLGSSPHCLGFSAALWLCLLPWSARTSTRCACWVSCCCCVFVTQGLWPTSLTLSSHSWWLHNL